MPAQAAPSSENLLLGKGSVYFDRFLVNTQTTQGMRHLGNVEAFELTTNDDTVEKYSSMVASSPLYKRVNRRRTVNLRITGGEFHPENLALFTMGTQSTLAQAATAVVGEAITATTIPGIYYKTKKLGPITAVAVRFGASTGVLGTDYAIIDAATGLIRILPGTILTGAVVMDYTPTSYATATSPQVVSGGAQGVIEGRVLFIGDPAAGPKVMVNVWRSSINPDGNLALIGDDYASMGLNAFVLDDSINHPASPLYEVTYLP
jgi:hypothetical protein